jgi:hypothetical protein
MEEVVKQSDNNVIVDEKNLNSSETFKNHVNELVKKDESISENLKIVLATHDKLKELKSSTIKFSEPVLKQGENAVIFPHTINVIQGQAGVHKSRLAEIICSSFLKLNDCTNELLEFNRTNFEAIHTVVYVDTERNLSEQLPYALQSIQTKAGYKITDHPTKFDYISLLQIKRKDRFSVLEEYLNRIKKTTNNPLFIVLDISTDCIEDFNKTDKSMELIDLMNMVINDHNVIFLCLIHENPKSDKARGHFGTELMNKSSTVMQVGYEKDANQNDTEIIRVKYLKCRSTARHSPFYMKYCNETKGLILAEASEISSVVNSRKHKASNEDLIEFIQLYLEDGTTMARRELIDKLCKEFKASERTIEIRLKEILESEIEIFNKKGEQCKLSKKAIEKTVCYELIPNESL